jgi:anti-sigma B factor antagonist
MELTISTQQGRVPVTIIQPHGDVDASNYNELIKKVEELFKSEVKDFVIDLSDVPFMSSAGLVALHSVSILLRGERPVDPQSGWGALKAMDRDRERGMQKHVKLFGPQQYVADTFEKAGFTQFFEIYNDLQEAVASF